MRLYLYDPRYNLKTETSLEKMCKLFRKTKGDLKYYYKSKGKKINNKYYIIDENTSKKQLKEFYSKEVFKDEIWKTIEGSEGQFIISNYGRFKRIYKSIPEGKFLLPYYIPARNRNKNKQFIKVKFKGIYKEYTVARLVAYHFIDIYYTNDKVIKKSKDEKYKYYTYDDVTAYHKNGLVYDNYAGNLEWLDRYDLAKKTAYKGRTKGTIVAKDAVTGEVIDYFRSTRDAEKHLYVSRQAVSDSLNKKWKTNIVAGTYIFEYDD